MGSRHGSSHGSRTMNVQANANAPNPSLRIGRDQLPPWRDNATALQQIIQDTGYSLAEAQLAQATQIRYYGDDFGSFTEGLLPNETEIISQALMRMPYYNGGPIYRGISLPDAVADRVFLDVWKRGTVQMFTDKLGNGNAVVQSFSSELRVADSFGDWNYVSQGETSIRFIVADNKTAPGVQHISKFGTHEAEVLLPSYQWFKVISVTREPDTSRHGRRYTILLSDQGRKAP